MMTSFFRKILGKRKSEYSEILSSQSLPTKLELNDLSDNEIHYIQNNIGLAKELLKEIGLYNKNHTFDPELVGEAIKYWFYSDLESKFGIDVNMFSNALAAGWGNYLEERMGMEWKVITDAFNTEIGLYHPNKDATVFPFSSTAKAFNKKDFKLLSKISEKVAIIIH